MYCCWHEVGWMVMGLGGPSLFVDGDIHDLVELLDESLGPFSGDAGGESKIVFVAIVGMAVDAIRSVGSVACLCSLCIVQDLCLDPVQNFGHGAESLVP